MPKKRSVGSKATTSAKRPIDRYEHTDKQRVNNPPVGLVTAETEKDYGRKTYAFDPHIDPRLEWAGKKERTSFEVPTVALHVHEWIDPKTIVEAIRKKNGDALNGGQLPLFELKEENPPLREALDFYKHPHGWSNRLIAGDALLVMNSFLEKEGLGGQVQMVYLDPPYGIRYGSNFQPFINKRDVKDGKDEDLTQEPEMVRAFRDTWELGIHSYLSYLRDRLTLAKNLLSEEGSCFVQISDENIHHVKELMDEVFGADSFCSLIVCRKTSSLNSPLAKVNVIPASADFLIWYARNRERVKYRQLYVEKSLHGPGGDHYRMVELPDGSLRPIRDEEVVNPRLIPGNCRVVRHDTLISQGHSDSLSLPFKHEGRIFHPGKNSHWKTTRDGLARLAATGRLAITGDTLSYKRFFDDFPVMMVNSIWDDIGADSEKNYVVQTPTGIVSRCILMTTDPGDLVLDPTCGSGTTAFVAEKWGRRWVTCDTSRVAITLAKQRLMAATYDYFDLSHPDEGVGSGFRYRTVPHVTLKSVANAETPKNETLWDQPVIDQRKVRVTGPFTVEAVPATSVRPIMELDSIGNEIDVSVARTGSTLRHSEWTDELLKTGIRGKGGQKVDFSRVEALGGTRWLHAVAETRESKPQHVVVSFGPEHAPLEQKQVELAWNEARTLNPKPAMIVFAAFQFDPEAAKDIDELTKEKAGFVFLKAQMNTDLLTDDLKKARSSNQSFWLIGQPDVDLRVVKTGADKGKHQIEVRGFDYYDTRTGKIDSGDAKKIAMWMLDPDYDGRSLYPRQVFFPMADDDGGWAKLAKNLRAEIDEHRAEAFRGTISLPFEAGKRVAVKIIDDRGIESLRILDVR